MSATDRDLEMMAWLAERDMEAVAHAHAQFVAATEPEAVASLGRTYQRVSRCLRSTLALKMKAAEADAKRDAHARIAGAHDAFLREGGIERRTRAIQDAVDRVAGAAIDDPREREVRLAEFDVDLDDWSEEDDFLTADLDEQVLRACALMDLPEDLARAWRALPRPPPFLGDVDDNEGDDDAAGPPPARRDSG